MVCVSDSRSTCKGLGVVSYVLELIPLAYYNLLLLEHFVLREVKN